MAIKSIKICKNKYFRLDPSIPCSEENLGVWPFLGNWSKDVPAVLTPGVYTFLGDFEFPFL